MTDKTKELNPDRTLPTRSVLFFFADTQNFCNFVLDILTFYDRYKQAN